MDENPLFCYQYEQTAWGKVVLKWAYVENTRNSQSSRFTYILSEGNFQQGI